MKTVKTTPVVFRQYSSTSSPIDFSVHATPATTQLQIILSPRTVQPRLSSEPHAFLPCAQISELILTTNILCLIKYLFAEFYTPENYSVAARKFKTKKKKKICCSSFMCNFKSQDQATSLTFYNQFKPHSLIKETIPSSL